MSIVTFGLITFGLMVLVCSAWLFISGVAEGFVENLQDLLLLGLGSLVAGILLPITLLLILALAIIIISSPFWTLYAIITLI